MWFNFKNWTKIEVPRGTSILVHFASLMYQNKGIFKKWTTLKESSKNEPLRFIFKKRHPNYGKIESRSNRVTLKESSQNYIVNTVNTRFIVHFSAWLLRLTDHLMELEWTFRTCWGTTPARPWSSCARPPCPSRRTPRASDPARTESASPPPPAMIIGLSVKIWAARGKRERETEGGRCTNYQGRKM